MFAIERLGLRAMTEAELSHPKWNVFRRSLSAAGLDMDMVKLGLICSFSL